MGRCGSEKGQNDIWETTPMCIQWQGELIEEVRRSTILVVEVPFRKNFYKLAYSEWHACTPAILVLTFYYIICQEKMFLSMSADSKRCGWRCLYMFYTSRYREEGRDKVQKVYNDGIKHDLAPWDEALVWLLGWSTCLATGMKHGPPAPNAYRLDWSLEITKEKWGYDPKNCDIEQQHTLFQEFISIQGKQCNFVNRLRKR